MSRGLVGLGWGGRCQPTILHGRDALLLILILRYRFSYRYPLLFRTILHRWSWVNKRTQLKRSHSASQLHRSSTAVRSASSCQFAYVNRTAKFQRSMDQQYGTVCHLLYVTSLSMSKRKLEIYLLRQRLWRKPSSTTAAFLWLSAPIYTVSGKKVPLYFLP